MIVDYFKFAVQGLISRKIRSWLTMLGIFVGIAAVVALISLGQGFQMAINDQFARIGSNRIVIVPGARFMGPGGSGIVIAKLLEDDVDVVGDVRGVELASGIFQKTAKIEFNDEVKYISVQGFSSDDDTRRLIENTAFLDVDHGRQIRGGDTYAVVLGYAVANDYFEKEIKNRDKILIDDYEFTVVGVQKKAGTMMHDLVIRIPIDTARDIFEEPDEVSMIFALTKDEFDPFDVSQDIRKDLRKHRDVEEDEEDFSVQTAQQTISAMNTILNVIQVVLIGIASISLVVGGIGIMNTMYTSVLERHREIGIMKAIGAKNSDILLIFLIESGLLGIVGGLIGLALGLGMSFGVAVVAELADVATLTPYVSFTMIIAALSFSFIVGSVSGVMPAMQAARLNPVDALRPK